jgi:hypothetical protein
MSVAEPLRPLATKALLTLTFTLDIPRALFAASGETARTLQVTS